MIPKWPLKPACRSGYDACPIGIVGDDIEIIFLHYENRDEAKQKWTSRVARLPKRDSALYVKICDRDGFEEPHLRQFFALPFRHKICFAKRGRFDARRFPIVEVDNKAEPNAPDGSTLWDAAKRHATFDLQKWLPDPRPSRLRHFAEKLRGGGR